VPEGMGVSRGVCLGRWLGSPVEPLAAVRMDCTSVLQLVHQQWLHWAGTGWLAGRQQGASGASVWKFPHLTRAAGEARGQRACTHTHTAHAWMGGRGSTDMAGAAAAGGCMDAVMRARARTDLALDGGLHGWRWASRGC